MLALAARRAFEANTALRGDTRLTVVDGVEHGWSRRRASREHGRQRALAMPPRLPPTRPSGRLLAIDFGERRVGLALSDPDGRFAVPYGTLRRTSDRELLRALRQIADDEAVAGLVLGEPRDATGQPRPAAERVRRFAAALERALERPVELVDESLTSVEAAERLRAAGVDARRRPERIDAIAAQVMLEEVLARPSVRTPETPEEEPAP